jgi:hypothetical protein
VVLHALPGATALAQSCPFAVIILVPTFWLLIPVGFLAACSSPRPVATPQNVSLLQRTTVDRQLGSNAADDLSPLPMASCVASLPSEQPGEKGLSALDVASQQSSLVGKRVRITAMLSYRRPWATAFVTSFQGGRAATLTLAPVPHLVERGAGEACVTLDAMVVEAPPRDLWTRDGAEGALRDATLVARSEACDLPEPTSLAGALARAKECKADGGPTGPGHASITFSGRGSAVSAVIDEPPYAGTPVGRCIEEKLKMTRIPPYTGGDLTVRRSFSVP